MVYQKSTDGGTTWTSTTAARCRRRRQVPGPAGHRHGGQRGHDQCDHGDGGHGGDGWDAEPDGVYRFGLQQHGLHLERQHVQPEADGQRGGLDGGDQVSADGGTSWSTTTAAQSNLADGTYQFRTVVMDVAGNTATSSAITVTVGTSAPAAGTLALTNFADSGSSGTDFITQDKSFDLSLTGNEAGSTVAYQVSADGGTSWSTTTAAQSNRTGRISSARW